MKKTKKLLPCIEKGCKNEIAHEDSNFCWKHLAIRHEEMKNTARTEVARLKDKVNELETLANQAMIEKNQIIDRTEYYKGQADAFEKMIKLLDTKRTLNND